MAEVGSTFVSVVPSAKGFGKILDKQVGGETKSSGKRIGSGLGSAISKGFLAVGGALAVTSFFKGAIGEAREAQKVGALTAQVIKTTGGAANVTAKQVGALSTAISNKTGIDDEAIQSGANLLLTFKNIKNETGKGNKIFDQATQSITDLGAAMGKDPKSAAIQLGKALNDPIKGITALSRVGVSFTEGQKKTIKSMVEGGNTLGAQKIILKELKSEFGGAAAAQATFGDKAKVAFGNLQEAVGTALLPIMDRLFGVLSSKVIPAISGFITQMQSGKGAGGQLASVLGTIGSVLGTVFGFLAAHKETVATFAAVLLTIVGVVRAFTIAQAALNFVLTANPIGIVIVVLAALVTGLILAYKHSETFRKVADAAFRGVADAVKFMWNVVVSPILKFMITAFGKVAGIYAKVIGALSKVPGFGWLKPVAKGLQKVADGAADVAAKIHKIPDKHNTKVTLDTGAAKAAAASFIAGLPKNPTITLHVNALVAARSVGAVGKNAHGTNNWRGGPSWVGERGPEIVNLPRGARVTPNNQIHNAVGGGRQALTITNWKTGEGYIESIADSRVGAHARMNRIASRAARP